MTYTYATDKPARDLVSYQSVRGAEVKAVFQAISEATPVSQLHSQFVKPSAESSTRSVDYTINFLQTLDFVDKPSDRTVEPIDGQPFEDLPFELRVFHHLKQQKQPQDHFARIHEVVVEQDMVLYDKEDLLEDVKRELGDYPFDWNVQKIQTWYNLMSPFGLVSVRDNQDVLTSPAPVVVYDLLDAFTRREDTTQLRKALDWIETNFFGCYEDRGGIPRVHAGLDSTLDVLVADDILELSTPSDATYEVKIPSANADKASSFELGERPSTPAYSYPLESHELEVSQ
ncbi:hypothetical protein [Natronorubrum sp. A-ect3]|uniref:hypothetical protein n=1 Tax=Natronorubrum sp. A-ect3 TaxID=3242698 RepID=UPI00359E6648